MPETLSYCITHFTDKYVNTEKVDEEIFNIYLLQNETLFFLLSWEIRTYMCTEISDLGYLCSIL